MALSEDNEYYVRDESYVDLLKSLFSPTGNGLGAVLKVIGAIAVLGWFGDSLLTFIQGLALKILGTEDKTDYSAAILQLGLVIAFGLLYVALLYFNRKRTQKIGRYLSESSFPHRGLIIGLSTYSSKGDLIPARILDEKLDAGELDIDEFYNLSNFGLLAYMITHHSPLLQKCWICVSEDTKEHFDLAKKLVNYVSKKKGGCEIECEMIEIGDGHEMSVVATKVSSIYEDLSRPGSDLRPSDVISNYSGGTAAISGGIIIATIASDRKIEYLSQKYFRKLDDALLSDNRNTRVIISAETNPEILATLN